MDSPDPQVVAQSHKEMEEGTYFTTEQFLKEIQIQASEGKEAIKTYAQEVYKANRLKKGLRL